MTTMSTSTNAHVDLTLSRPTYRLGGTIVGTIRANVVHATTSAPSSDMPVLPVRPSDIIESLQLSVVGLCRLDPRWHRSTTSDRHSSTTTPPQHPVHTEFDHGIPTDFVWPSHTVPFWTAGSVVELMNLPERLYGRWDDTRPTKSMQLPNHGPATNHTKWIQSNYNKNNEDKGGNDEHRKLNEQQICFTFRVNLPKAEDNCPHSLNGTSCRYYYSIILRLRTTNTASPKWILRPVTVLSAHPDLNSTADLNRESTLQVMAHSSGLPAQITASELNQWEGQYTVNRYGGSQTLYRNVRPQHVQSMCIHDPITKCNVAVLTIFGSPTHLHPGCRLSFKFDFPRREEGQEQPSYGNESNKSTTIDSTDSTAAKWIPCYQVSACLQGQEVAIHSVSHPKNRSTSSSSQKITRRYVWNTAHEVMDPETTECVSLDLLVPESIPCTVRTNHVEIVVQCVLDITVGTTTSSNQPHPKVDYRDIHMEIPCQVRHAVYDWERVDTQEDMANHVSGQPSTIQELFASVKNIQRQRYYHHHHNPHSNPDVSTTDIVDQQPPPPPPPLDHDHHFCTKDIHTDLKILSFQMAKACDLRPNPTGWK
jgi:hypothetical protein